MLKQITGTFRLFFLAMLYAYTLSNLGFLALRTIFDEQDYVMIAFFNTFLQLLWLPMLIFLPIALLLRQKRLVLMLLPLVALWLCYFGGLFLPKTIPLTEPTLRLLTYNSFAMNRQQSAIVDLLRSSNADIITLQELSLATAAAISADLLADYPYQALHPQENPFQGQGVISKYPIVEDAYWQYDWLPNPLGHQRVLIELADSTPIVLYNVHPTHPGMSGAFFNPTYRYAEIADILQRSQAETQRVILLGDFNFQDTSPDYALLKTRYQDSFRVAGWGFGWTFPIIAESPYPTFPFLRLDYVWYSEGLEAQGAEVITNSVGSDHYPLQVSLILSGE